MISLKYVGQKPEHEDTMFGTGTWKTGQTKKVDPKVAPHMLFHGDVWQDARKPADQKKDPIVPMKRPRSQRPDVETEHDVIHVPIHNLTKEALQTLAKNTFNRELSGTTLPEMRAEIRMLQRMRP